MDTNNHMYYYGSVQLYGNVLAIYSLEYIFLLIPVWCL